jgi:hypothetical protein
MAILHWDGVGAFELDQGLPHHDCNVMSRMRNQLFSRSSSSRSRKQQADQAASTGSSSRQQQMLLLLLLVE